MSSLAPKIAKLTDVPPDAIVGVLNHRCVYYLHKDKTIYDGKTGQPLFGLVNPPSCFRLFFFDQFLVLVSSNSVYTYFEPSLPGGVAATMWVYENGLCKLRGDSPYTGFEILKSTKGQDGCLYLLVRRNPNEAELRVVKINFYGTKYGTKIDEFILGTPRHQFCVERFKVVGCWEVSVVLTFRYKSDQHKTFLEKFLDPLTADLNSYQEVHNLGRLDNERHQPYVR